MSCHGEGSCACDNASVHTDIVAAQEEEIRRLNQVIEGLRTELKDRDRFDDRY